MRQRIRTRVLPKNFHLEDKIEFLEKAIREVDDEDDLIEFVAENYQVNCGKRRARYRFAEDIEDELQDIPTTVPSGATAPGDLTLDSQGPLVAAIQAFLILKDIGPAAKALAAAGATGYFGPVTQRALIEYQVAHGISPATGYFGPKTRAYMLENE